jgi:hypothetical protein
MSLSAGVWMVSVAFAPLQLLPHDANVFVAFPPDQVPGVLASLGRKQ